MSRPFQFTLRATFFATALFSMWVAILAHRAHRQRDAVAKIEALGGIVYYHHQDVSRNIWAQSVGADQLQFDQSLKPSAPRWLRELLGDDWFRDVVVVDLSNTNVDDAQMLELHTALPQAAISAPLSWASQRGSHHMWPSQHSPFDAVSLAVGLIGAAFALWIVGQFVARRKRTHAAPSSHPTDELWPAS